MIYVVISLLCLLILNVTKSETVKKIIKMILGHIKTKHLEDNSENDKEGEEDE